MTATFKKPIFDLSSFDQMATPTPKVPANQLNIVLAIPVKQIIEDESQPRKDFNDDEWDQFVEDIKRRGITRPLDIRPAEKGIHKIINGARRYRAAVELGLSTLPCIIQVDETRFDDYAQLLDNIKNKKNTPMDIALFIQKRLDAGDSKGDIAERLSVAASFISNHLALLEMPPAVAAAYKTGKVQGAQLIYRLNKLYKENPSLAEVIINEHEGITNALIIQARKSPETGTAENIATVEIKNEDDYQVASEANYELDIENEAVSTSAQPSLTSLDNGLHELNPDSDNDYAEVQEIVFHNPAHEDTGSLKIQDPTKIKKPLLLGHYHGDQACVLQLHERPSTHGFIWIKLENTGESLEVPAESIKLNLLTEAKVKE